MERKLCQDWLDRVADCVFTGDVDTWTSHFSLPLSVLSDTEASSIDTIEDLTEKFETWRRTSSSYGVTSMVRTVRDVIQGDEDRIVARYDTDLLAGGKRVMPRFASVMVLERQGTRWRCTEVVTGIGATDRYLIHDTHPQGTRAAE